ncbi:MAG: tetratricopeptide repeat protein [bacterium]|nr:tetratricopeptide repeat protein [bacterium]MCP5069795.1 tetratricopeptide repeat protein [bacterium]
MRNAANALLGLAWLVAFAASGQPAADARLTEARKLSWAGEYRQALESYRVLAEESPGDISLQREIGLTQLWAGRELDAIATLQAVIAADPSDAEVRLALGRANYYLDDAGTAAAHYLLALPAFRDDPAVVAEAVGAFRAAERDELANRWLEYGLSRFPDQPEFRIVRAEGMRSQGELGDAARELESLLEAHPDHPAAQKLLAKIQAEQASPARFAIALGHEGHYRKARRMLRRHLREHPEDMEARLELAHFTAWNEDYAESQALYGELLAGRPDDRLLRTELAEVTSWRGQYGPARSQLEALLDEQPDDLRARVDLGNVHAWTGARRLADATYRGVLAVDPEHAEARNQLAELERQLAPALGPGFSYFEDNAGFSLWTAESRATYSSRPGRQWSLDLDVPRIEQDGERVDAQGFRVGFTERADERWEWGGELGAVRYSGAGASPRVRVFLTRFLGYRQVVQLDLRHGDALPDVRSIESALGGVDRSTAFLVHMYNGERFTSWTRLEAGRYSDDPTFWAARSVLGYALVKRPVQVDLLVIASAGDYSRASDLYYSPNDLVTYALGLRFKTRLWDRLDLVLIGESGRIHSDGGQGTTYRIAPELIWEMTDSLRLSLRYDHYESLREGEAYTSDFVRVGLRYRLPVAK